MRLNPLKSADRARLAEGAERLKAQARERAEGAPLPAPAAAPAAAPPSPLEAMSDEERRAHHERASATLKDRLARLARGR
ncbi:MAG: hypothetical protein FJ138_15240 [Deltaproteobacteria bacterium]|nr:hypothetical protein [Deltaproteobacteria bacterium]